MSATRLADPPPPTLCVRGTSSSLWAWVPESEQAKQHRDDGQHECWSRPFHHDRYDGRSQIQTREEPVRTSARGGSSLDPSLTSSHDATLGRIGREHNEKRQERTRWCRKRIGQRNGSVPMVGATSCARRSANCCAVPRPRRYETTSTSPM